MNVVTKVRNARTSPLDGTLHCGFCLYSWEGSRYRRAPNATDKVVTKPAET